MSEKFPNLISVVNINIALLQRLTNASYSAKSNEYVYKMSTRSVTSVSSYKFGRVRCVHGTSYELATRNKEAQQNLVFDFIQSFVETYSIKQHLVPLHVHGGNGFKDGRESSGDDERNGKAFDGRSQRKCCVRCCPDNLISPFGS